MEAVYVLCVVCELLLGHRKNLRAAAVESSAVALAACDVEVGPYCLGECAVRCRIGDLLRIAQKLSLSRECAVGRINTDPKEMTRGASACRRSHMADFARA